MRPPEPDTKLGTEVEAQEVSPRTPSERAAIQKLYEAGVSMTKIARRFDCSRDTVVRIVRRRTLRSKQ
jgi:IS30 family transposase